MSSMAAPRPDHPPLLPALPPADRAGRSARDWAVDTACVLLAIVYGAFVLWEAGHGPHPGPHPPRVPDVLIGLAGALTLWTRRRHPVVLALVLACPVLLSITVSGAAAIALFTVAVHRPFRTVALVAALHLATGLAYEAVYPSPTESYRAQRAEAEQQLRVEQARHQERARIAREMHDVLAHRISLLSVHAGALEFRPGAPAEEIARAAGVIRASAHQALQDLREIIGVLRDDSADGAPERPQPDLPDLPALIEESRRAGMSVKYENRLGDPEAVPTGIGRNAYRTIQEALTNARKHAPGATVHVTVEGAAGPGLTVEVRNPLVDGESGIPGSGTGLIGLAERALLAGGRLEHGRTADGEFRVRAWLPWPA